MNYYPFHIGDYLSATRHLTWVEDAAYRRLLDTYYTTEKRLPLDLRAVCRLVLATTDEQREAVRVVLDEFFEQTPEGWKNSRADTEIDAMRCKQLAQESKDRHETERMRRYRERRGVMFTALRALEIVPAWDVSMKELQRLYDEHCNATKWQHETPETHLQREQVVSGVSPATAISTNTNTNTITNTPPNGGDARKRAARPPARPPARPDEVPESVWQDFQAIRKAKRAPLTDTALEGIRREAARAGLGLGDAIAYCCEAGWQGFNAGWYAERTAGCAVTAQRRADIGETAYQRSMRERIEEVAPDIARRAPAPHQDAADFFRTIDATARVVEPKAIEVTR